MRVRLVCSADALLPRRGGGVSDLRLFEVSSATSVAFCLAFVVQDKLVGFALHKDASTIVVVSICCGNRRDM